MRTDHPYRTPLTVYNTFQYEDFGALEMGSIASAVEQQVAVRVDCISCVIARIDTMDDGGRLQAEPGITTRYPCALPAVNLVVGLSKRTSL